MLFSDVIGLDTIKSHLISSTQQGRIPHAQLFVGQGLLPIALAYAQAILCQHSENPQTCATMMSNLAHPDLHLVFPVATTEKIKSNPVSSLFMEEWREFVINNPYGNLFQWLQTLGIENKQGQIGVAESHEIIKKLSLKAYQGGYKVMIIWYAEKMNTEAANKILKILEEPPHKTVFLLLCEDQSMLLDTIISRCQLLEIPLLSEEQIAQALVQRLDCNYEVARDCARQANGNYNTALEHFQNLNQNHPFEAWTIQWIRTAFKAKGNPAVIHDLLVWSEQIATSGREVQKYFLEYCIEFFRQALLLNYEASSLVYLKTKLPGFDLKKFAPFVHGNNIIPIIEVLEEASYHIERNGNPKVIFSDLSFKLTRLLHQPMQPA